ncbi:MAG: hypothetical protein K940chlam8_00026 [Chlamydiae bacterium]|nr:hypothetical protein [Chlamydiota bacterium]
MKLKHSQALRLTGIIWFFIGLFLVVSGVVFFFKAYEMQDTTLWILPLFPAKEMGFFVLFLVAMILGFLKARFLLMRMVKKMTSKLLKMENPVVLKKLYPVTFYLLVFCMLSLGLILRLLHIPQDVKAFVMLTVGIGLLNGSALYFQFSKAVKTYSESGGKS